MKTLIALMTLGQGNCRRIQTTWLFVNRGLIYPNLRAKNHSVKAANISMARCSALESSKDTVEDLKQNGLSAFLCFL